MQNIYQQGPEIPRHAQEAALREIERLESELRQEMNQNVIFFDGRGRGGNFNILSGSEKEEFLHSPRTNQLMMEIGWLRRQLE